jgi:glycosyltransferase involved in cell wall biosynthesis
MNCSILHLIRTLDPERGGPVAFVNQISAVHAAMGVKVSILSLEHSRARWVANLPVSTIECADSIGTFGYSPSLEAKMMRIAPSFGAIVVNGLWQFHGLCAMRVSARLGIPYFVFPHGMLDPWFRKSYPLKHVKKQLYWALAERRVLERATAVLFTSVRESRLAKDTFLPRARYRVGIVPLGVPKTATNTEQLRETFLKKFPHLRGRRFLLFLGRLHPKKGCDFLVRAMAELQPPVDLVIAGPIGDRRYAGQLKKEAEGLAITFTGMLDGEAKNGALVSADALILPSHQENFGLVVAEALSFGTPVLLSNQVNIAQDIVSSGAGFIEPDTFAGTVRLIERWLEGGNEGMRMAALKCFQNRFDIQHTARELLRIVSGDG